MDRRGLVFGLVFLLMGVLFLVATSLEFDRSAKADAKYMEEHPLDWHLCAGPSAFEEGADWAGLVSVVGGLALLTFEGINSGRRRKLP